MSKLYIDEVLRVAAAEVGYCEKATNANLDDPTANAGSGNWTKYARDLWAADPHFYQGPKNGYDWCCCFVDYCFYKASDAETAQKALCYTGPYGAGCGMSVMYYKEAGRFTERVNASPRPGDQIFFGTATDVKHTGLVERVDGSNVYTIEGNSSNKVQRRSYKLSDSYIYGYGRPRYDGDKAPESPETGFPFSDVPDDAYYRKAVEWAVKSGIVAGTSTFTFSPQKKLTRADAVVMLYEFYLLVKGGG